MIESVTIDVSKPAIHTAFQLNREVLQSINVKPAEPRIVVRWQRNCAQESLIDRFVAKTLET